MKRQLIITYAPDRISGIARWSVTHKAPPAFSRRWWSYAGWRVLLRYIENQTQETTIRIRVQRAVRA